MSTALARHPDIARALADIIRPRERVRPSDWAERHIVLTSEQSPRPGPWSNAYLPWIRALQDLHHDYPRKEGVIEIKPSQIGSSRAKINVLACLAATDPGPTLYMTDTADKATSFANSDFKPAIMGVAELAEYLNESRKRGRRQLTAHFELPGGEIDFVGAGTESGAISRGRRWVFLDEFELSERGFPVQSGSLFETARNRTKRWRHSSFMWVFGHPRGWEADLHRLYLDWSDQRRWAWPCPHCGSVVDPTDWEVLIDWRGGSPARRDTLDPSKAVLACPHCSKEITDSERARVTWPAEHGGEGHLWTPLDDEQAEAQPFVGLWITRLSDPNITIHELADSYARCQTEEALQVWTNKEFGAPRRRSRTTVTVGTIRECIRVQDRVRVPGGADGVRYVSVGIDVQMPRDNPTLYFAAVGFAPTGLAYVLDLKVLSGWANYHEYRAHWAVQVDDSNDQLGLSLCTLDCGWETRQVLDETRRTAYSIVNNAFIRQLAVSYNGKCHADLPIASVPAAKCMHPTRPELGPVPRRYLHRHTWVDRVIRRYSEKRYVILCEVPEDFEAHMTAQVLTPLRKQHALDTERFEWEKAKGRRDDWHQALAYAEAGAAIELGLDRIHELNRPLSPPGTPRIIAPSLMPRR